MFWSNAAVTEVEFSQTTLQKLEKVVYYMCLCVRFCRKES